MKKKSGSKGQVPFGFTRFPTDHFLFLCIEANGWQSRSVSVAVEELTKASAADMSAACGTGRQAGTVCDHPVIFISRLHSVKTKMPGHFFRFARSSFVLPFLFSFAFSGEDQEARLKDQIQPLISSHEGKVAVSILHLNTGQRFDYRADEVMPTASLIKLPVMVEVYRQIAAGQISPDQMVELKAEDKVPGSGVLTKHFSDGCRLPLRDVIQLMIAYSDNTATNLVVDQIGLEATARTMAELGYPETKLHSKVYRGRSSIFPERSQKYGLGSTTSSDIVDLLKRLHEGKLVSREYSNLMLQHLEACEATARLPRLLPPGVKVAHKSGAVSNARCDAGIIYSQNGPIALCTLTSENEDQSWGKSNAAELFNAKIAKAAYDYFNPKSGRSGSTKGVLAKGDFGIQVEHLQRTLNARLAPSPELSIDGDFGPATLAAVRRFQATKQLEESGIVDADTWKALSPLLTATTPVPEPELVNAQQLPRSPADELEGVPFTTCKAWAVDHLTVGHPQRIGGSNVDQKLEIASTTKVMTAYLVLNYAARHPEVLNEVVTFSYRADRTRGSTAGIAEGESLPVSELLYGLMLPSGNDAAVALAEHFGSRLAPVDDREAETNIDPLVQFIDAMNDMAIELKMTNTTFRNPHGMSHPEHLSTASDLLKLAQAALQVPLFRKYISTRQRGCVVSGAAGYQRNVKWTNSNRLLKIDGYSGVKTGTTESAGACLISLSRREGQELLLVVLGSASTESRYTDSRNLFRWAWQQIVKTSE